MVWSTDSQRNTEAVLKKKTFNQLAHFGYQISFSTIILLKKISIDSQKYLYTANPNSTTQQRKNISNYKMR